ncbi:MAG: DUF1801 domain-containing protein [Chloroflexota bacterium]|nr:DUF1801 domain-containing protein [Chloroflexota bacterium]
MSYPSTDEGFNEVLADSTPGVRDLAVQARELIRDVMPDVVEVPWPRQRIAGYGVGPKKMTEHFCYISVHKSHIDLGFNYGSELPDPDGLLQGTGKLFRHLKITTPEDLARPAVRRLLEAASTHRMPSKAQAQ